MHKVVINNDYGGYSLDQEIIEEYVKRTGKPLDYENLSWDFNDIERTDPILVEIVENLDPEKKRNQISSLVVDDIPDDFYQANAWSIEEYDGLEHIKLNSDALHLYQLVKLIKKGDILSCIEYVDKYIPSEDKS